MLFKPELIAQILAGEKTETRRYESRARVGRTYAVKRNYLERRSDCPLIRILSKRREELCDITISGALAEGFDSLREFWQAWREIHGDNTIHGARNERDLVYVIRFELARPYPSHVQETLDFFRPIFAPGVVD